MKTMFQVCQRGRESRWTVTLRIQFTVPISTRSKPFSMQLTRRGTRCKPAARPRSGSVIGRPQHRSSNQFGGDRYKRAIHRDVGSPRDIVPRPVGDFLDFAALAGHLDVFYCLLTSSPRELFPQLRKALPNKTRRRGKGIKLSVPLARESLLFAGRLRWSRRASPFQGGTESSNPCTLQSRVRNEPGARLPCTRSKTSEPPTPELRCCAPSARADQTGGGWPRSDECDALANQKIPTNAWNTILSPVRNALREARHGSGHVMDRVDAPGGSFGTKTPCSILICVSGPVPSGGFGTIRPRK